jgi:hypothetical protein
MCVSGKVLPSRDNHPVAAWVTLDFSVPLHYKLALPIDKGN